ncbi:MAG: hypothetical protein AAGM22_25790 [Acidobacteriota bacterium]
MTKSGWILVGTVGLALVMTSLLVATRALKPEPPPWTTRSSEALRAFERGLDSLAKYYGAEAAQHFARAVELDRDFAVAKLQLLLTDGGSPQERERWFRELGEAEISQLSPREQFLIGYWRLRFSGNSAEGKALLDEYLARYPKDPWALSTDCGLEWEREAWDQAESCYRRLIAMHPNWVRAQNRLGLIAMARGQFKDAEEHFRTYGYIAPDQAAPWDSLGQLLAVRGHYDEASEAYQKAVSIKDDYCSARWHVAVLESLRRRFDTSETRLRELEAIGACGEFTTWGLVCSRRAWNAYSTGDLASARAYLDDECLESRGGFDFVAHRLALAAGDLDEAVRLELALKDRLREKREDGDVYVFYGNFLQATGKHLVAMRTWSESGASGDRDGVKRACRLLREADDTMLYWGIDRAMFKLFNLRQLARCYDLTSQPDLAARARADLDRVNPRYRAEYAVPELPGTGSLDR